MGEEKIYEYISQTKAVLVNIMSKLGWTIVTRNLVKQYSRCFCEGAFWMRFTFKIVDFE